MANEDADVVEPRGCIEDVIIEWLTIINSLKWKELTGSGRITKAASSADSSPATSSDTVPNSVSCC